MYIRRIVLSFMGVLLMAGVTHAQPQDKNHRATDPNELGAKWWAQALSLPAEVNSFFDETKCGVGQRGSVWNLYSTAAPDGVAVVDECTLPSGKSVFLALVTCISIPDFGQSVEDSAKGCAEGLDAPQALLLEVNGRSHPRLIDRRTTRHPFPLPLAEDNIFAPFFAPGVFSALHDGYYAHLPPLKPGDHEIHVLASIVLDDGTPIVFETRHRLHVVEPAATLPAAVPAATAATRRTTTRTKMTRR